MPRSFKIPAITLKGIQVKDPRVAVRIVLGVLWLANLAAAVVAFKPFGGGAEDLQRQERDLRTQLLGLKTNEAKATALVTKVQKARTDGDNFLGKYLMDRRVTFQIIEEEIIKASKEAGIKRREASMVLDPIEGSDSLQMMTITAGFEGTYAQLTKFIGLLDKSPRFLIIENMVAAPMQGGQTLNITLKLDAFVKEVPGSTT
jgi:hypothetical protein